MNTVISTTLALLWRYIQLARSHDITDGTNELFGVSWRIAGPRATADVFRSKTWFKGAIKEAGNKAAGHVRAMKILTVCSSDVIVIVKDQCW